MLNIEEVLDFIFENLEDERVSLYKTIKNGYRSYHLNVSLKLPDPSMASDFKMIQVIVDCRNKCIEIGHWEDLLVFENAELTSKWADKLEEIYSSRLENLLSRKVDKFFNKEVNPVDMDFTRRWKMRNIFDESDEEDEERELSF